MNSGFSPYRRFGRDEWAALRSDTPMTLSSKDLERLQGLNDPISMDEVEMIYLPVARLLGFYIEAVDQLQAATSRFLAADGEKMPFIIGIAGSVAVGKSTTARLLQHLLDRGDDDLKVDLITTDGFLHSNDVLRERGLMERKGFPESYDVARLLEFLHDIKSGKPDVTAPVYSHLVYDIVADEVRVVDRPDVLILEGLNVLQTTSLPVDGSAIPFVSDYFDFSIFLDADERHLLRWYIERFRRLRDGAFRDPRSYFRRYAEVSEDEALTYARGLWDRINGPNLRNNIIPTRGRADLVLHKGENHQIDAVHLRKL